MTRLFSITTLFVFIISVTQAQDSEYYQDAVQLAARLVADQPEGEISEHLIYSIEDALNAIAESPFAAANAVSNKYNIHTQASANTSNVRIIVGKDVAWATDFSQAPIQKLLPNYELTLSQVEETDSYFVLDVASTRALNMKFIANEISVIDDIWMVELPSEAKDGNDIKLRKVEEGFIITYSFKSGNCNTGCEETHYWEFGVKLNGDVEFIGEHGSDLADSSQDEEHFFTLLDDLRP